MALPNEHQRGSVEQHNNQLIGYPTTFDAVRVLATGASEMYSPLAAMAFS
jgi:hypothetical protein